MAGFGAELRAERERLGLSIERVCAETKVQPRYLEALEQGDYETLPGGVFRKGIVRSYVRALGLDEAVWMDRFHDSGGEPDTSGTLSEEVLVEFAENIKRGRSQGAHRNEMRWGGVLVMALGLVGAGWLVWHYVLAARLIR